MAFGGKKSSSSSSNFGGGRSKSSSFQGKNKGSYSGAKKTHNIKSFGAVFEGKHGPFIKINDYHLEVILKDKETGMFYAPKLVRLGAPFKEKDGLLYELSVNLENENAVEPLGSDDEE